MKLPAAIPTPTEVVHYALLLVAGSLLVAWIQSNLPAVREQMRRAGF